MRIEYLLFNLFIFLGPVLSSYIYKGAKKIDYILFFKAIIIPAIFFIIWDEIVTGYFWYFNNKYILGLNIIKLPIEEMLFFFTVPFACLFLWINIEEKIKKSKENNSISFLLIFSLLLLAILSLLFGKFYSANVLLVLCAVIFFDIIIKTKLFSKYYFYYFLTIVFFLTFLFNGYLTARPVVIYNELLKTNINIFTIPIEDFIYGLALVSWVVIIYKKINFSKINK